jgi:RNA polymerase sigma factor (sigma-70 family)
MCIYDKNIKTKSQNPCLLDMDEEKRLIIAHQAGDPNATTSLIASIQHLLNYMVSRHVNKNASDEDLYQECLVGAIKAIDAFDVGRNVRLTTLAKFYIRRQIDDFIAKNAYCAKAYTTKNQRRIFFNMGRLDDKVDATFNEKVSALSEATGLEEREVGEAMGFLMSGPMSFDEGFHSDDSQPVIDSLTTKTNYERLERALSFLDERQRFVITAYFFEFKSQKQIGDEIGLHKNGVRDIITNSLEKLKGIMRLYMEDVVNG